MKQCPRCASQITELDSKCPRCGLPIEEHSKKNLKLSNKLAKKEEKKRQKQQKSEEKKAQYKLDTDFYAYKKKEFMNQKQASVYKKSSVRLKET